MDTIKIKPAKMKGEDGHKTFSIRIPDELYLELNDISIKTKRSRNEIITLLLQKAVSIVEIDTESQD